MDRVKLLNRTDTKFVFSAELLPHILEELLPYYAVLEIGGKRTNRYRTLYYDTLNLTSYVEHHNGKANRVKIRVREYVDSDLRFLEVKRKNNKGRTIKSRKAIDKMGHELSDDNRTFVTQHSGYEGADLLPVLVNHFTRLTLVHQFKEERLTIDLGLLFEQPNTNKKSEIMHIVIAEVKQPRASKNSEFMKAVQRHRIREGSMSKYCVGMVLLNDAIKYNNFKERILNIKKLGHVA